MDLARLSTDPVKLHRWSVLTLCFCFSQTALAEDIFISKAGAIAQAEVPSLDPDSLTERSESTDTEAVRPAAIEPPVVLEGANLVEPAASVQGKRVDRKWRVIPFGRLRITADDNLFISHSDPKSDVYFTITPGIAAGWGDYSAQIRQLGEFERYFEPLSFDFDDNPQSFLFAKYNAGASFFLENTDQNAVDHDAFISGRWEAAKLTLGFRVRYQTLSGADIELGDRVKRQVYTGAITSEYHLSEKTALELNLNSTVNDYETGIDWSEWSLESYLNYRVKPKTQVALGTRLGITEISSESKQTFEQLVARVMYGASSKLAMSLEGGVEWRQYDEGGNDDFFTVFGLTASYAPFDGTQVSTNAFRRNYASVSLANANITATGVAARIRQRFLHRFYLTVEGGFQNAEYRLIGGNSGVDRTDDTVFVKPSISFDVTKFLSAETAYQYQRNDSSVKDNSFTENTLSFQVNFQF